jgi:hypothetical protein
MLVDKKGENEVGRDFTFDNADISDQRAPLA